MDEPASALLAISAGAQRVTTPDNNQPNDATPTQPQPTHAPNQPTHTADAPAASTTAAPADSTTAASSASATAAPDPVSTDTAPAPAIAAIGPVCESPPASPRDPTQPPPVAPQPPTDPPLPGMDEVLSNPRKEWTTAEDELIRSMVGEIGTKWRQIAAKMPGRSDDAVRNRFSRLNRSDVPVVAAAPEPQLNANGEPVLGEDGQPVFVEPQPRPPKPPPRPPSERYSWTRSEDDRIRNGVKEIGHKWFEIAKRLPGRTDHAVRNRWSRLRSILDTQSTIAYQPVNSSTRRRTPKSAPNSNPKSKRKSNSQKSHGEPSDVAAEPVAMTSYARLVPEPVAKRPSSAPKTSFAHMSISTRLPDAEALREAAEQMARVSATIPSSGVKVAPPGGGLPAAILAVTALERGASKDDMADSKGSSTTTHVCGERMSDELAALLDGYSNSKGSEGSSRVGAEGTSFAGSKRPREDRIET